MYRLFTLLGVRAIFSGENQRSPYLVKKYAKLILVSAFVIFGNILATAQISGTVYRDFNANGIKDDANEIGLGGITVTITSSNGVITTGTTIAGTTTATFSTQGTYSITPSGTAPFRVEFSTLPTGHFSGPKGSQSGTSVQFVSSATTSNVNLGINYPSDYCETNPRVAVPCYVNGNPLVDIADNSKEAGLSDAMVSFPYNSSGSTPSNVELSLANSIGSTWGLAYGKQSKALFASAMMKRHVGFGPSGTGAIYRINNAITTSNFPGVATFLNLNSYTLGGNAISTGADPHSGLPGDKSQANLDNASFDKVGRISFGDLEINEKEDSLFVVNLNDKKLYAIYLGADPANPVAPSPGAADSKIKAFTIPNPNCNGAANGDYIPWGLKFYHGVLYVGVVCTAQTSQNKADLKATVYALNLSTGTFTEVLINNTNTNSISLNFARGSVYCNSSATTAQADWRPWRTSNVDVNVDGVIGSASCITIGLITYPQPILSDIEFDSDGSMIIGFADRLGNQSGRQNQDKNGTLFSGFSQGDILRAFPSSGQWKIENNGTVNGFEGPGKANNEGPGSGEFYGGVRSSGAYNPIGDETADHSQAAQGGLTVKYGSGQVMTTLIDPTYATSADVSYWSGGVRRLNGVVDVNTAATTNNGKRSNIDYLIYDGSDPLTGSFGKANGLGDLEVMCGLQPIEIGNRVWSDVDGDGIQDPNETGIGGVTVKLYKNNVLVGTTITSTATASLGEYYFNTSNVTGGLLPNMAYEIRIELNQSPLTNFDLTTKDVSSNGKDAIDSDFAASSGVAILAITTGAYGNNNHTYDCGFNNCPTITKVTPDPPAQICVGESVTLKVSTNATNLPYTDIEFVRFTSQQANPYTSTDASKTYLGGFSIPSGNTTTITNSITTSNLPNAGNTNITYYVYACVKPAPTNPNCIPKVEYIIVVKPKPGITLSSNAPVCQGGSINLSSSISVVSGATFGWAGPSFTATTQNPSIPNATTAMSGIYSFTVTATSSCTNSATTSVSVLSKPTVNVSATGGGVGCVGGSITLSATGGNSYVWSGPNAFSATIASPILSPLSTGNTGTYSVSVTGTNTCTASATVSLSVNNIPNVQAGGSIVCEGQTLNLTSSGGINYSWSGPNGFSSTDQNPVRTNSVTTMSGTYVVTVTNSVSCTASASTTASINPKPIVTANSSSPACIGGTVTLSATGGSSYTWGGPNSYAASGANPNIANVSTVNQGIYTVTAINGFNCTATATTSIIVNPKPTATASSNSPVCEGNTINLSASGGTSYSWSGPSSFSSTEQNPTRTSASTAMSGVYTVSVSNTNSCTNTATVSVVVNPKPTATASSNSPVCEGNSINLSASGGTSYSWSGPSSFSSTEQNPTRTSASTAMSGVYTVSVSNTNSCTNTATVSVVVNPKPTATASSNSPVCEGNSINLSASGGTSYSWSGPSSFSSTEQNPTRTSASTAMSGVYTVSVSNTNSCTNTATVSVVVNPKPTATASSNSPVCEGNSINLSASGGTSYSWSGPSSFSSTEQNPTRTSASTAMSGVYTVSVSNANSCTNTATVSVTVVKVTATASSNSPVCTGGSISLTASGGTSYSWSGPDGFTSTSSTPIIPIVTIAKGGIYTITVTGVASCTATASISVVVNSQGATASSNSPVCEGNTINLSSSSGGSSYSWSGPGFSSTTQNPSRTGATTAMSGIYTVTVLGANSCTGTATVSVVVNPKPTATASSNSPVCEGNSINLSASGGTSYSWSGPSFTSTEQNPTRTLATTTMSGVYSVSVSNANSCSNSATVSVVVNPKPSATASSNSPVCEGNTINLSASGGTSYSWSGPSSFSSTEQNPTRSLASTAMSGVYTVSVSNANSCTNTATVSVVVNPKPTATASSNSPVCEGNSINLSASGGTSYSWSGPSSFSSTEQNPTRSLASTAMSGVYTVSISNTNSCTNTATVSVVVNPKPTATASSNSPVCEGNSINLSASGGTSYSWSGPSSFSSTEQNPTRSLASTAMSGVYTVSISNTNSCTNTATVSVVVNPKPTATASSNSPICEGNTINLSASGGTSYSWSGPSSFSSTEQNPTRTSASTAMSGVYTVSISNTNSCTNTATVSVVVNPKPTATASSNSPVCEGNSINLSASGGTSYSWSGPSFTSTEQNPTRTLATTTMSGVYSVSVSNANSCSNSATVSVVVNPKPSATASSNSPVCEGNTINLSASGGTSYSWSGPSSFSSTEQNPTRTSASTAMSGVYTVSVSNTNSCTNTATVSVVVNPKPTATASSNSPVCEGNSINLSASGGTSYSWSGPSSFSSTEQNPTRTSASTAMSGVYTVSVSNANSCTNTATVSVVVNPKPTATASSNSPVCEGNSINLSASGGTSYSWSGPSSFSSTEQNPTRSLASTAMSGVYTVSVSNTNSCTNTATVSVVVNPKPTATASSNSPICEGNTINLSASGGTSYSWSGPSSFSSTEQNPTRTSASTAMSGVYTVSVSNTNSCTNTATVSVVVNPKPTATASSNSPVCEGNSINLSASGGTSYSWSGPSSFSSTEQNPTRTSASTAMSGVYTVSVSNTNSCTNTATVSVVVNPKPTATASSNSPVCEGNSINLSASGGTSYSWSGPSSFSSTEQNPTRTSASTAMSGVYTVSISNTNSCTNTATVSVVVNPKPTATASSNSPVCEGNTINLSASGGNFLFLEWAFFYFYRAESNSYFSHNNNEWRLLGFRF